MTFTLTRAASNLRAHTMKVSQIVDEPDIPPAIGYVVADTLYLYRSGLHYSPANSDGMATVEVGAKPVKYHVHKAVLVVHSECFREALQRPWK